MSKPIVRRPDRVRPPIDRLMEKVKVDDFGCWLWQGYIQRNGYGYFRHPATTWAHRAAWLELRGAIPGGLHLDHLCRVKACVNPAHLEPVTRNENIRRAMPWTACEKYHPGQASRWGQRRDGRDYCKECARVSVQRRRDRAIVDRLGLDLLAHD